jgi:hypothetical protein
MSTSGTTDRPRDGSRVWELTSASGERYYLKQHQSQRFHEREVSAYRLWTPALGADRAPRLLAADPGQRAVLITALPGQIARGPHILDADEPEIHRQAGILLRRLHSASTATAAPGYPAHRRASRTPHRAGRQPAHSLRRRDRPLPRRAAGPVELTTAIGAFIDTWNRHPTPFTWIKDADEILAKIERVKTKAKDLTDH